MNETILQFINKESLSVLSLTLGDGSVHSAVVHFSSNPDGTKFFVQTLNTTIKAQPVLGGGDCQASLVVGLSEQEWLTLQMRGSLRMVSDPEEQDAVQGLHHKKLPDAEKRMGPNSIFLEFSPSWFRYTDFKTKPITIITSQ